MVRMELAVKATAVDVREADREMLDSEMPNDEVVELSVRAVDAPELPEF